MENTFEGENSIVLSDSDNKECNLTLSCENPCPILASTAQKQNSNNNSSRSQTNITSNDSRGSYIPRPKSRLTHLRTVMKKKSSTGSSDASRSDISFKDDSSLSILDFNELPDAQSSASLIHLNSKSSSIGSWLDHCFSSDEAKKLVTDKAESSLPYKQKHFPLQRGEAVELPESTAPSYNLRPSEIRLNDDNSSYPKAMPKSPFGSNDSFNSEFDFNEEELDLELLINEEEEAEADLDQTMKASQERKKNGQHHTEHGDDTSDNRKCVTADIPTTSATTFDFLHGLGFPVYSNNKTTVNDTSQDEDSPLNKSKIDSRYFAQASIQSVDDVSRTLNASEFMSVPSPNISSQSSSKPHNRDAGSKDVYNKENKFSSQSHFTSTVSHDGFEGWQCDNPFDFSAVEFKDDSRLQQDMFGNENFEPSGKINAILDQEEASFLKEHQFSLASDFKGLDLSRDNLHDFSTYRTADMTPSEEDDVGKVSIGTYFGELSAKLGDLNGKGVVERPSFGLKVRTPSPQKPCVLLNESSKPHQEKGSSTTSKLTVDEPFPDISALELDDTVDKSMMTSISNAISNMSSSLNNEDLAKFIVALSNKKILEQKVSTTEDKGKETFIVPSTYQGKYAHLNRSTMQDSKIQQLNGIDHNAPPVDVTQSTVKDDLSTSENDFITLNANVATTKHTNGSSSVLSNSISTVLSRTESSMASDPEADQNVYNVALKQDVAADHPQVTAVSCPAPIKFVDDELPSLPNRDSIFPPDSPSFHFLSSTRANLSLTRGSLSRESIEKLHRKLRVHVGEQEVDRSLPDVVSNKTSPCASIQNGTDEKGHKDGYTETDPCVKISSLDHVKEKNDFCARQSFGPLSQSSPEKQDITISEKFDKFNESHLSRLSSAFQQLLPSCSFSEMATVPEGAFDPHHLPTRASRLGTITEESETRNRASLEVATAEKCRGLKTEEKQSRSSIESMESDKHELSSCSSVDVLPKASSTKYEADLTQESRSSSDRFSCIHPQHHPSTYCTRSQLEPLSHEHPVYPSYYPASSVMPPHHTGGYMSVPGQVDMCHRMYANMSMPPVAPCGPGYLVDGRSFDSSVYSTRSHPAQHGFPSMLPYTSHHAASVMSCLPDRVGFTTKQEQLYLGAAPISLPSEVTFNEVICVGVQAKSVLPIKNTSSRWIQVDVRPISVTVNRQCAVYPTDNYVTVKRKHVIGPHSIEHTDFALTCHEAGRYEATIEIMSHLIAMEGSAIPDARCHINSVTCHATAEMPSVLMFPTPEVPHDLQRSRDIDLGSVVFGSVKCVPLRILNRSKVETPIRIAVYSSSSSQHRFFLSLSSAPLHPETVNTSVLRLPLAVTSQPTTVWLHLHAAPLRSASDDKPVRFEARIEAAMDAPYKEQDGRSLPTGEALDSVVAGCILGIGKLHAPRSRLDLSFTTAKGSVQQEVFPVKNVGNISVEVEFLVQSTSNLFSVRPNFATLPPGGDIEITIEFAPATSSPVTPHNEPLTALVLMNILPSGPQFEVKVSASVVEKMPSLMTQSGVADSPTSLLTNKTRLRWGGIPIGESARQKLSLRCGPCKEEFAFRASIKGDNSNSFQIVTSESGCDELTSRCDMMIKPGEDRAIHILFAPSRRNIVHAKLEFKTPVDDLPATKYTIPLSGYGGSSRLQIEGLQETDRKVTLLHNQSETKYFKSLMNDSSFELSFTVRNTGIRSAFVKIVVYRDSSCEQLLTAVVCHPSQFVLQERDAKTVTVRALQLKNNAFICLWSGDELARQMLRITLAKQSLAALVNRYVPQSHAYLRLVKFNASFSGEDASHKDDLSEHDPHSFDVQIFYNNIRRSVVEIISKEQSPDLLSLSHQERAKSLCDDISNKEPERDISYPKSRANQLSRSPQNNPFNADWDVIPSHVALTAPPAKSGILPEASRVKIVNRSLCSLVFDVVWPAHYLTITPNQGRVEPESVSVLLVSANPSLASRPQLLPWTGQAILVATGTGPNRAGTSRTIRLQIKDSQPVTSLTCAENTTGDWDVVTSHIPTSIASPSSSSKREIGRSSGDASLANHRQGCLIVKNTVVDFQDAVPGKSSKSHLEFRNMSKLDIKWFMTSFSPPFVKNTDSSGDVFRSTYAAFVFSQTSGQLEPGARILVEVTFNPMSPGFFTQHWEIEYHEVSDTTALTLQQVKISLQGQCVKLQNQRPAMNVKGKRKSNQGDIYISEATYNFEKTSVGKSCILKIPIKNKGKNSHTVKFVNIRPPFHTAHLKHTVRSMYCANLPVTFKPTSPGTYTGTLVIETDTGQTLHVNLEAATG